MPSKKRRSERELIDTGRDKRIVRRDKQGRFVEVEEVSRSLSVGVKKQAKTRARSGQGDNGDQKRNR